MKRFQGVLDIVRFNWPTFAIAAGLVGVGVAVAQSPWAPWAVRAGAGGGAVVTAYFLAASLVASYWIYDCSELMGGEWAKRALAGEKVARLACVHAGLDGWSARLRTMFAGAEVASFDLFESLENPEPSIVRARKLYPPGPQSVAAAPTHLPVPRHWFDAAVVGLAAHEIRQRSERVALLRELGRCVRKGGPVIVAEHLRDGANAAVFGTGAFHFYPRSEWMANAREAGLEIRSEECVTPFIRIFVMG